MTTHTIDEQIAAVKRELSMRRRVYPRWVAQHKMTREDAAKQIALMESVLATLEAVKAQANPALF